MRGLAVKKSRDGTPRLAEGSPMPGRVPALKNLCYCRRFSFFAERMPAAAVSFSHIYAPFLVVP
jgi:hypothetical protein